VPGSKGIVGPWVHQYPHTAVPGPQIGFLQECVRWWDRWLKGVANGVEEDPAMRAYLLHSAPPDASAAHRAGEWVACDWPAPAVMQVLPLSDQGLVAGPLAARICTAQQHGMDAGEFFPMGLNAEMPGNQAGDDALAVCFDGAVLAADLTLLGRAELRLRLSADAPKGHLIARLCDVAPDGSSVRMAHGMLNLCHRGSMAEPAPMLPGQGHEISLRLDQMAYRVAAGHRLRLALATTYWPFVWPSDAAVTLTLAAGSLHLPVVTAGLAAWLPPPAETATPWAHRVLRDGRKARRVERDLIRGTHALVVEDDGGDVENLTHGLVTGETMTERWEVHPDDPLSARATHVWEQRLSRGDWRVRTHVTATQTCTATHLRMTATVRAWEGDALVFERSFDEQVAREFV
jgi:predicted acyl esterase